MKTILSVLAVTFVLSVLLPAGIFAAQKNNPLCSVHSGRTCFVQDNANYCSWSENARKTNVTRGRAGQLVVTPERIAQIQTHKCAQWEHSSAQ
jgi:hypothetical protein